MRIRRRSCRLPFACWYPQASGNDTITSQNFERRSDARANSAWRLFGGVQHDRARRARDPARNEILQPRPFDHIVHRAAFEVKVTRLRARRIHADAPARGPAMHHGVGHVRMKLEAERMTVLIRLHRKVIAFGEKFCAARQLKSLAVPMVDALRPTRAERVPVRSRTDRIVTDLHRPS